MVNTAEHRLSFGQRTGSLEGVILGSQVNMAGSRNVSGVLTTLLRRSYSQLTLVSSKNSRVSSIVCYRVLLYCFSAS